MPIAEIELLFGNLLLISAALAAVGCLDHFGQDSRKPTVKEKTTLGLMAACLIGMVQGICLPFRGFSRSGATISTGLILGIEKKKVEDFSFALAVILTPPVILMEALRFLKAQHASGHHGTSTIRHVFAQFDRHGIEFYFRIVWPLNGCPIGWRVAVGIYLVSIVYVASAVIIAFHCNCLRINVMKGPYAFL